MDTNPYQPPQASDPLREVAPRFASKPARWGAILLALVGMVPYWGFIVVLLNAGRQDRQGGLILASIGVLFAVLGLLEIIFRRGIWRSYATLIIGQMVITAGMLAIGFGSPGPVLAINGTIIVAASVLGALAFVLERRQRRGSKQAAKRP